MPGPLITPLRAISVALILTWAVPLLAQARTSLIGESRAQVLAQLGEPKSNIVTGPREMLFFARVKVTLKDNVVVQVDDLPSEPSPAPAPTVVPRADTNPPTANSANAAPEASVVTVTPQPAPPAPPPLVIKFITADDQAAAAALPPPAKPAPAAPAAPRAASTSPADRSTRVAASTPIAATPAAPENDTSTPAVVGADASSDSDHPAAEADANASETPTDKTATETKQPAGKRAHWLIGRDRTSGDDNSPALFSTQSYLLIAIVLGGGIWYFWWRYSQRRLELAATEVSRTPFEHSLPIDPESHFTAELVDQLGQARFQKLVATYYAKTGVVTELADSASASPMQIRIFWKDEPKPYAGVLCLADPPGLIDAKPLHDLSAGLAAEGIGRGYVVTNGRFSVEARDFATEKQLTLMSGDIFLEKLNALPPTIRAELLQETSSVESVPPAAE